MGILVRRRWLIAALVAVALVVGAFAVLQAGKPEAVEDLEKAKESADAASSERDRIVEHLNQIEENLAAGAGLSKQSDAIGRLTERQGESLHELEALLRDQLEVLERAQGSLGTTSDVAQGVARLGKRQNELLRDAIDSLRSLQDHALSATRISAYFAWQARYGARLAEDSRKRFQGP